jgi:hypothetical protein
MAGKNTAAFGIYRNLTELERGVDQLRVASFRNEDISVLFPENQGSKDFAHEKHTKAPEGATTGATTGALLGGALGWLVGAVGAVGGLTGALVGAGIPEYEAKRYEGRIKEGGILLSVHCDDSDWTKRAKDILERTGAQDVASTGEAHADFDKSDRPIPSKEVA